MPLSTYPLIAWGSPDDLSAYTVGGGTPVVTSGVADPFGGTGAYSVEDNDGAVLESIRKQVVFESNGQQFVGIFLKADTASLFTFAIYDITAAAFRLVATATWSGGVPSMAASTGSIVGTVSVGNGWYCCLAATTTGVLAANDNRLYLYGAGSSASATGKTSVYVRNVVLLDLIDNAASFKRPAPGYRTHRNSAGVRESYKPGADIPIFAGRCRHVPQAPEADPGKSGWYGENEAIGVNCGVLAMLAAGWDGQLLRFVKDRSNCASGVDAYLGSQPAPGWRPDFERSWQYAFDLELETASLVTGV